MKERRKANPDKLKKDEDVYICTLYPGFPVCDTGCSPVIGNIGDFRRCEMRNKVERHEDKKIRGWTDEDIDKILNYLISFMLIALILGIIILVLK